MKKNGVWGPGRVVKAADSRINLMLSAGRTPAWVRMIVFTKCLNLQSEYPTDPSFFYCRFVPI